jgi:hypothetical protein
MNLKGVTNLEISWQKRKGDLLANPDQFSTGGRIPSVFSWMCTGKVYIRHIEMHTAEAFVQVTPAFEVEVVIAEMKSYRSQSADHTPSEIYQACKEIMCSEIHKLS